ncbi:MAG TPA: 3-deoxy-manno-octulosonate cytidylyltransferase [Pyrinomonadaceae bacterium]|nr:3-deoxy-manno-octulosonate cytidylyltransferase [Pyrinomonadaceae bacterium]
MNHTGPPTTDCVVAVIPARYASSRFPGKPLAEIAGRPMVVRVAERARAARTVSRVLVATDDERVYEAARAHGFEAAMTRADHPTGSDRLAEVAAAMGPEVSVVVNVQGDEPLLAPETIDRAVAALLCDDEAAVATTFEKITEAADVLSPDVVKVVVDGRGRALYFTRSAVPFPREAARRHGSLAAALAAEPELISTFRKHTGLYVYRREFLLEYAAWPASALERAESLEQLRILERGARIVLTEAARPSIGVDTPEDLERVRAMFAA